MLLSLGGVDSTPFFGGFSVNKVGNRLHTHLGFLKVKCWKGLQGSRHRA